MNDNDILQQKKEETVIPTNTISFVVAKWAILRLLALVYCVAFVSAWNQNGGLLGRDGLLPAELHWKQKKMTTRKSTTSLDDTWQQFLQEPCLFWYIPMNDMTLDGVALAGVVVSSQCLMGIYVSWCSLVLLWLLQFTLVTIAQHTSFYQYGWESQLLETGFLAIFLCDLPCLVLGGRGGGTAATRQYVRFNLALTSMTRNNSTNANRVHSQPSSIILYLFRWLSFRISLGAGLIKIRGASCWTHKTCLWYHFETQPLPSPLSFVFHFLPKSILRHAVDLDLWVQLYTSWMVLILPIFELSWLRQLLRLAGLIQAGFMVNILISGNLSFLNHLTIIPALACLDDDCWPTWMIPYIVPCERVHTMEATTSSKTSLRSSETTMAPGRPSRSCAIPPRWMIDGALFVLIAYLSRPVIHNLLAPYLSSGGGKQQQQQVMNASFDRYRLVNTYGAFGDVGHDRFEAIISVSTDLHGKIIWNELEFPCKPGKITRRPCFCAPYHYRLDWNIWFLGFPPHTRMLEYREQWLYRLVEKLLDPRPFGDRVKEDHVVAHDTTTSSSTSTKAGDNYTSMMVSHPHHHHHKPSWWNLLDSTSVQYLEQLTTPLKYVKVDMYQYQMAAPLWEILRQYYNNHINIHDSNNEEVVWWKRTYKESLIKPVQWDTSNNRLVWASHLL